MLLSVTHQQPCFARTLPKDLGAFVSSLAKVPWASPSKCEFLVESTWHVETTGWKITTVSGEYHIIYRSDVGSFWTWIAQYSCKEKKMQEIYRILSTELQWIAKSGFETITQYLGGFPNFATWLSNLFFESGEALKGPLRFHRLRLTKPFSVLPFLSLHSCSRFFKEMSFPPEKMCNYRNLRK